MVDFQSNRFHTACDKWSDKEAEWSIYERFFRWFYKDSLPQSSNSIDHLLNCNSRLKQLKENTLDTRTHSYKTFIGILKDRYLKSVHDFNRTMVWIQLVFAPIGIRNLYVDKS